MKNITDIQSMLKFKPNYKGVAYFYILLFCDISLIIIKEIGSIKRLSPVFFSHISNLVITSILMSIISFIWLLQGASFKLIVYLGLFAVFLNFIIEIFVKIMNTPDVIDAVYGTAGAIITILVMLLIRKKGLVCN